MPHKFSNSIVFEGNLPHRARATGFRISSSFEKENSDYRFSRNPTDAMRKRFTEIFEPIGSSR